MLSLLLALFLIWFLFKLGIGFIKILIALVAIGLTFVFFAYLVIPLIAILFVGGLLFAIIS
ncbi:hypothetical protein [Lactobacillus sp. LL6]|uniref:hypothetical protein n=1 Tax=Lactobacillus sp. LL6 TaxID=2596827 RepID=UPI00118473B5|nr:hypothetical protein [Lactobacillus sp. LL6]TSO25544.1 hypothetical protein FOD82_00200 [Lactobacillus sp. LL6]